MSRQHYAIGSIYAPPVVPFRMMVVDFSPCGSFVTFAARHPASGAVLELTLQRRDRHTLLKPQFKS